MIAEQGSGAVLQEDEVAAEIVPEPKTLLQPLELPEPDQPLIMGIESSCDETAVALLKGDRAVLANVISSSAKLHEKFGGIVPEVASRAHVQAINPAIAEALNRAESTLWDLSAIAVTIGPGLVGSLVVGVAAAKALASVLDVPLIGVNHLEAHIYSNFLENPDFAPPAIGLIVSGGHTLLVNMQSHGLYELVGKTLDDAAGEAFDKIARFLGLGFPGGPEIEAASAEGDPAAIAFPRALAQRGYDFSFSGLKTSVINYVRKQQAAGTQVSIPDVAASFQEAVVDVLVAKTIAAAEELQVRNVFVCGGVAANRRLKHVMAAACQKAGRKMFYPSPAYCTDNAAMVACCGYHRFKRGVRTEIDVNADPNLPLA